MSILVERDAEIARLKQRLEAEEFVSCTLSKGINRLRGALEGIVIMATNGAMLSMGLKPASESASSSVRQFNEIAVEVAKVLGSPR